MKIAIFENEYESVKGAFDAANLINFNETLEITIFPSSQTADLKNIMNFEVVFIDIDLSSKSELDGYSLIQKLNLIDENINKKIIILTGNNRIIESLSLKKIENKNIKIIIKPTEYEEISKAIFEIRDTTF